MRIHPVLVLLFATLITAAEPVAWDLTPSELAESAKKTSHLADPTLLVCDDALQAERYGLQAHLSEGWWRVSFQLRPDRAAKPDERLDFSLWNPYGSAGAFRFNTSIAPAEFGPGGKPVAVVRTLHVGPDNGNIGFFLRGGWKGLGIAGLRFEPLRDPLFVEAVRAGKLVYGIGQAGSVEVRLRSGSATPQQARLVVEIEDGLAAGKLLHDADITIPAGKDAFVIPVPLTAQAEYGHQLRAVLRRPGKDGEILGEARDWFYVSDRPVRIGHLAAWGSSKDYQPKAVDSFVRGMRRNLFPLAECTFWAPDDFAMLVPPAGKDRWWSGQTLAQLSTSTITARIDALHAQGMKALGYTDLRLDFGFRASELFRVHPEWCNWDANNTTMGWSSFEINRQLREDDAERFDPKDPNKPLFDARGVWGPQTGNPAAVDYHIGQLVASAKLFGWDGFRYDDPYDYDFAGADMLGRAVPFTGFTAPVLLARLRGALQQVKPGMIYGHNMEWLQKAPSASGQPGAGDSVETPMPLDTPPEPDDYYTEHLRDDGLHLQERTTAYWGDGANWEEIAEKLNRLGHNAARRGGHAYAITSGHNWASDGRTLTALMFAGRVHLAYWASAWQQPYLRLAARHCDLLYGDSLRPAADGTLGLTAKTGGHEPWWKSYVRVLEPAPGKRIYLVHLINPPAKPGVDTKNALPPAAARDLDLTWHLPAGWKAERAWHLSADRGEGLEASIDPGEKCEVTNVSFGAEPGRMPLPLVATKDGVGVHLDEVVQWSIVAVECSGQTADRLPAWRFALPPVPAQPKSFAAAPLPSGYSPNGLPPIVFGAGHQMWQRQLAGDKREPQTRVADATCVDGKAVRVQAPLTSETYFGGVQGGRYRFSLRVKSAIAVPAGAVLHLRVWPAGRVWQIDQNLSLASLKPGAWTDLTYEQDIGSDRGNCGVQITGGWDGLLIDRVEVRELKGLSEVERLVEQKLRPWPKGLAPAKNGGAWVQFGLWHEGLRLETALKACGVPVARCDWWTYTAQRSWNGPKLEKPEDLAQYRLVVLANIDLRTFTLEPRAWLKGWVEAGGSLMMTGGPYALGRGWWQESDVLAPILPATLTPFDLRPAPQPLLLAGAGPLAALKLPSDAVTGWVHELTPKPGAIVALTAGGKPALVLGEAGKGRVALLALAPLGEDVPGAWWRSAAGGQISEAACHWLLRL